MGGTVKPKKGDKVRIPKDTVVTTMHPSRSAYTLKRAQVITVDHTLGGHSGSPLTVRWAGSGGYWCEADVWEIVEQLGRQ